MTSFVLDPQRTRCVCAPPCERHKILEHLVAGLRPNLADAPERRSHVLSKALEVKHLLAHVFERVEQGRLARASAPAQHAERCERALVRE
jgi:hypothetical protein